MSFLPLYAPETGSVLLLAGLIGLAIGSFLNVVIARLPKQLAQQWQADCDQQPPADPISLAKPASHCPYCKHHIAWYDNIPVLSWVLLRAKCRACGVAISWRYPGVELLTGVIFATIGWHFGMLQTAPYFYMLGAALLIALFFIDLDAMLLPDSLTLSLLWLGLWFSLFSDTVTPRDAIIGASAGYLSLWTVFWGFKLLTGRDGMGYGDFKLLAAMGAWLGWQLLPVVVIVAAFSGALIGIIWQLLRPSQRGAPIPFGPFLIIGGALAWWRGAEWLHSYWYWLQG